MSLEENVIGALNIRNQNDENRVNFIKNTLLQPDIPPNFVSIARSNIKNIFYLLENGKTQRRSYVLFENNKFYCVHCVCFSPLKENGLVRGVEYVQGCRISEKLKTHDTSSNHQLAQRIYLQKLSNLNGELAEPNTKRNVLRIILKIIIFLATHGKYSKLIKYRSWWLIFIILLKTLSKILIGMAFRGDSKLRVNILAFDVEKNYFRTGSYGNFFALVKLIAGENHDLAEHLKQCRESANIASRGRGNKLTFLSSNFVDNVLLTIRKRLVITILDEIRRNGGNFGLEIDGSQDVTFQEQLSFVLRYVNDKHEVAEHTIKFLKATDTSGKAIFKLLETSLNDFGFSFDNLVGYSFDGASNMRFTLDYYIKNSNINCMYTWCFSHRYNLVMKTAIKGTPLITSILDHAENTARVFRGSHNRMDVWIDVVKSIPNYNSQKRLKLIGNTRWSSKQEAVHSIIDKEINLYVVIKALLRLLNVDSLTGDTLIITGHVLNGWLNYENVVATFILNDIFNLLMPTTKFLQNNGLDIVRALESVRSAHRKLDLFDLNISIQEAQEFIKTTNSLLENDSEIALLDIKCCIALPTKEVIQQITEKLTETFETFIRALQSEAEKRILNDIDETDSIYQEMFDLDPQRVLNNPSVKLCKLCAVNNITNELATNELKELASEFLSYKNSESFLYNWQLVENDSDDDEDTLRIVIDTESEAQETSADLGCVKSVSTKNGKCSCFECILKYIYTAEDRKEKYKNISKIYKYVLTLPSTQVKCERDFSRMKLLKTRLRTNLSETSLENFLLISTESELFDQINLEEIIDDLIANSPQLALYVGL